MSKSIRPSQYKWYVVDARGNVRACITGCLGREARRAAELMFGEGPDSMCALQRNQLSLHQNSQSMWFSELTPTSCVALLGGIPFPFDQEARDRRKQRLKAKSESNAQAAGGR